MLSERGHPSQHVADVGLLSATDDEIWERATETGAVLITKDEDFARLHLAGTGPVVIWIRMGNTTRRALMSWVDDLLPTIEELVAGGERLIELR